MIWKSAFLGSLPRLNFTWRVYGYNGRHHRAAFSHCSVITGRWLGCSLPPGSGSANLCSILHQTLFLNQQMYFPSKQTFQIPVPPSTESLCLSLREYPCFLVLVKKQLKRLYIWRYKGGWENWSEILLSSKHNFLLKAVSLAEMKSSESYFAYAVFWSFSTFKTLIASYVRTNASGRACQNRVMLLSHIYVSRS